MDVACLWNKYDPDPLRCYLTAMAAETRSHQALTCDQGGAVGTQSLRSVQAWAKCELPAGQALREPAPLFKKLDESVVEEEYARLEG